MQIRISRIFNAICCLILLLDFNFFYIFKLPSWLFAINSKSNKFLIVILILLMALCVLFFRQKSVAQYKYLIRYSLILFLVVFFLCFYTSIRYDAQGINSTIRIANAYLIPLIGIPIVYIYEKEGSINSLIRFIEYLTFFWYAIAVLQFVVYSLSGKVFLYDFFGNEGTVALRNNTIRLTMFTFGNIFVLYHFGKIVSSNYSTHKSWHLLNFIMGLFCVFFIQKTRMFYLVDVLGLIVILYFSGNRKRSKIRNMLFLFLTIGYLIFSGTIQEFFNSIFYGNEVYRFNSTEVRLDAVAYYIGYFFKNPVFGMGLVSDGKYPIIVHGPFLEYYFSDVGFVGVLAQTGLFSLFIYIMPIFRMVYVAIKIVHRRMGDSYFFQLAMTVFFLAGSVSIPFTHPAYAVGFAFAIAYTEIINKQIRDSDGLYNYIR